MTRAELRAIRRNYRLYRREVIDESRKWKTPFYRGEPLPKFYGLTLLCTPGCDSLLDAKHLRDRAWLAIKADREWREQRRKNAEYIASLPEGALRDAMANIHNNWASKETA